MNLLVPFVVLSGFLVFAAFVFENAAPNPLIDDEHQAYPFADKVRYDRKVAALSIFILAVMFLVVATYPQGVS